MIIDNQLVFDPAGSAITATRDSTNIIDLSVNRDLGVGDPLSIKVIASGGMTPTTATLQVTVQGAPDNGSGAPGTYEPLASGPVLTGAQINSANFQTGGLLPIDLPRRGGLMLTQSGKMPRFLKLTYTVGSGPFTAGSVQAFIALDQPDEIVQYPSGFNAAN